ncbi:MAG: FprA family A-type flavoprotein [Candidatus Cryptobacteroides sp.]
MSNISRRIIYVGVTDYEKKKFEGLWPLPYGVTYNSYIVADEKVALIDTADGNFEEEYIGKIKEALDGRSLDYLIVNHMEPDHSSLIKKVMEIWPDIRIVTSPKAVPMICGYHGISQESIIVVKDGESLSLGSCSLQFHMTPMVHWPETMMTWLEEEGTLFSGDAFGTFGAVDCPEGTFGEGHLHGATVCGGSCLDEFREEMIRYYSNIVGKYGAPVQAALKKLGGLPVKRICSTHGPVWTSQAAEVVALYDRLSKGEVEKGVCIAYSSMYGNTEKAAKALAAALENRGIPYGLHDLCLGDGVASDLGMSGAIKDLFKYDTVAVGAPTYNGGIFPPAIGFMEAIASRGVKARRFFAFGSYTWAAASVKQLQEKALASGLSLLQEGIAFPQAFSSAKCDMAAVADAIACHLD